MNILYIGGFLLPDKNAAAQRVVSNAKAMRELGNNVFFLNALNDDVAEGWKEYFGFPCYEYKRENMASYLTSIKRVKNIVNEIKIEAVIAYNYPSVALNRLVANCKRNGVLCYADATEWYVAEGSPIFKIVKNLDSSFRMKTVHCKMDGIIAISSYLFKYYNNLVHTVQIPPLVDIQEEKWQDKKSTRSEAINFVYAGSPNCQKERLDLLVAAMEHIGEEHNVHLDIVGMTAEQYFKAYHVPNEGNIVEFHGIVSHNAALRFVKNANWSVVIRDNNLVVKAGFPTKVSESISARTPVIANRFSNIEDYLDASNSILVNSIENLEEAIRKALVTDCNVDNSKFDYHNYLQAFEDLFEKDSSQILNSNAV